MVTLFNFLNKYNEYNSIVIIVGIIAVLFTIIKLFWKLEDRMDKHIKNISDILEKKSKLQDDRIDIIANTITPMFEKIMKLFNYFIEKNTLLAKSSPVRLTQLGNAILEDANLKKNIEKNYADLIKEIDFTNINSNEEKNNVIIETFSKHDFKKYSFVDIMKKYVDKTSDIILSEMKELVAVYIRDLYFEKKQFENRRY